jgi:hypothetical protein
VPRNKAIVGSYGGALSHDRGTPASCRRASRVRETFPNANTATFHMVDYETIIESQLASRNWLYR